MRTSFILVGLFVFNHIAICEDPPAPNLKWTLPQTVRITAPGVFPVRIAVLPFIDNANTQEAKISSNAEAKRDSIAPGEACEPWMFPVTISDSPSNVELESLTMSNLYMESGGTRITEGTSRVIQVEVASFEDIVKWYSAKLGETRLSKALKTFNERATAKPDFRQRRSTPLAIPTTTHLTYRFTPTAKRITILYGADRGDIVAISLLGTKSETSIEVIRRFAKLADVQTAIDSIR